MYELSGRLCFDGKNVFPKDCRLSHFWPGATGKACIWDWQRDVIAHEWTLKIPDLGTTAQAQSTLRNDRGVDGAAAIPRLENDGKGTADPDQNAGTEAHPNGERHSTPQPASIGPEVVTSPGEQRARVGQQALFGGDR